MLANSLDLMLLSLPETNATGCQCPRGHWQPTRLAEVKSGRILFGIFSFSGASNHSVGRSYIPTNPGCDFCKELLASTPVAEIL
jgi:hypothetical protein